MYCNLNNIKLMKKFTLMAVASLFAMAASAQTVQIFSGGEVVGQKSLSEVDSIAFNEQDAGKAAATLKKSYITMEVGEQVAYDNILDMNNLTPDELTIVSSDNSVVSPTSSYLEAKAEGAAVIMVSYIGVTEPLRLVVKVGKYGVMVVDDVFTITGRGTAATGKISAGGFSVSQSVTLMSPSTSIDPITTVITGIDMFRKSVTFATTGDEVGFLLRGIDKSNVERGSVIVGGTFPEYGRNYTIKARLYVLTKAEGGRHTPFYAGYRPQMYVNGVDFTAPVTALGTVDGEAVTMVMPGQTVVDIEFTFASDAAAIPWTYLGQPFTLREGGKTIARGIITGF